MRINCQIIALLLMISAMFFGCTKSEEHVESKSQITIETDYLRLISDLTQIMEADYDDPESNLDALRKYIESSQAAASGTLNALNRDVLALDPESREKWREAAKPKLEEKLDRFAKAQLRLRKRLTDAQNWELNEIIALLHS